MACADTVGKIAARAGVKTLVLTHHKTRTDATMLDRIREEVSADFKGRLIIGHDLTEIEV
jgi:ribonuclease Z